MGVDNFEIEITADGYFLDMWSTNTRGETVYPYIKGKARQEGRGFDVTPTGKKPDYRLMSPDEFLDLLVSGACSERGHIRMQPRDPNAIGKSGGFLICKATKSARLAQHLSARMPAADGSP